MPRYALFYPDGSIGILRPGTTLEEAARERWDADCLAPGTTRIGAVSLFIEGLVPEDVIPAMASMPHPEAAHG